MGKRGPVTGATYGQKPGPKAGVARLKRPAQPKPAAKPLPKATTALKSVTPRPPAVPEHLGVVGRAVWADLWASMPILSPRIDASSVTRYCEACDDASRARAEVEKRGLLLEEPIVTPRGDLAGSRWVANPAEVMLRRCDRVLTELGDRLGLTPAARARLGLTISQSELAAAEAGRILGSMLRGPVIDMEENE